MPARPIDPNEAARGRLDYAQVQDWGAGEPGELGGLKVKSFTPKYAEDGSMSFYEQMARQLEMAQVKGSQCPCAFPARCVYHNAGAQAIVPFTTHPASANEKAIALEWQHCRAPTQRSFAMPFPAGLRPHLHSAAKGRAAAAAL